MELLDINNTAAREHVSKIKRAIQYLKQRFQCVVKSLSITGIKLLHKQVVIHMCYFVTMVVNAVPANLGVSQVYSPREIVTQRKLDMKKDCKVQFGAYV